MELQTIGSDLGKTVFHLVGLDLRSEVVVHKKFSRKQLLHFTANLQVKLIGMEACGGSHFLGRALREQGHEVRLMPAQYVKPYVKTRRRPETSPIAADCRHIEDREKRLGDYKGPERVTRSRTSFMFSVMRPASQKIPVRLIRRSIKVANDPRSSLCDGRISFVLITLLWLRPNVARKEERRGSSRRQFPPTKKPLIAQRPQQNQPQSPIFWSACELCDAASFHIPFSLTQVSVVRIVRVRCSPLIIKS
jgi:hypothetical protein